jgi:hypothetical protein
MTFAELRALLERAAATGDAGILRVETTGPTALRVAVATLPGRSHTVWVLREGGTARLLAPAIRIPKGKELTAEAARVLLRRNASLDAGALALVGIEGEEHVALVVPLDLPGAEAQSLVLALVRAASAADGFEETLGVDHL